MIHADTKVKTSSSPPRQTAVSRLGALFQDNIVATILAMIVLVPLITGTEMINDAGKTIVFEVLGCLLLAFAVGRMRLDAGRLRDALKTGPNGALALLAVLTLVSCAFSPYRAFSWMETMRVGFGILLYFVLVYQLRGKGHLETLTDGLLLVTGIVSLLGFAQMGSDIGRVSVDNRLQGTFGSHELLGSFLLLMLPLALTLGLTDRGDTKRQLFAQVVALLATACLLMARARFAWVGTGVALVALSLLGLRYSQIGTTVQPGTSFMLKQMRQRKHLIVGPLLILLAALSLVLIQSQTAGSLQKWAATIPHEENFATRQLQWHGTLRMIEAKPLFGWGVGVYPVRQSEFTGMGDPGQTVLAHGTSHSNIAHNFYLQTAADLGLVGLGLYIAVLVGFFALGLRALSVMTDGLRKAVLIGCLAAMAGQVVDAAGSPAYNFGAVSLFQWVLLGLGMCAAGAGARRSYVTDERETTSVRASGISAGLGRRLQYGLGGLVALGLMTQVVPTMRAAYAQTCQVADNAFVVQGLQGQDTGYALTNGQRINLVGYFNGEAATGTTFSVSSSKPTLFTTMTYAGPRIDIIRSGFPGTGTVIVTATYVDGTGQKYVNQFVVNLR